MFTNYGYFKYRNSWLVVEVDEDFSRYYRSLLLTFNPSLKVNKPKYEPHITVISERHEEIVPSKKHLWGKHENEKVIFQYDFNVVLDREYFWLPIECKRIEDVREELGLSRRIPVPWHLTIANLK